MVGWKTSISETSIQPTWGKYEGVNIKTKSHLYHHF